MPLALSHQRLQSSRTLLTARGGAIAALAIIALPWPAMSLAVLVLLVSTIALIGGLLDAALFGALHQEGARAWFLLGEAFVGVSLGGALLVYPMVPLWLVAALIACWSLGRAVILAGVSRSGPRDPTLRALTIGWSAASVIVPIGVLVAWSETTILSLLYVLVAYALIWGALELTVARRLAPPANARG
jgi:uncharacterized membrane protein HdeD (DUF308 family)